MEDKVIIEVDKEQARIIKYALDLYSRILMGQVDQILYIIPLESDRYSTVRELLREIGHNIFPELGGGTYGIFHDKCAERSKVSYDILQVLGYAMANHEFPEGGARWVDLREPLPASKRPLCKVNIRKEEDYEFETKVNNDRNPWRRSVNRNVKNNPIIKE